MRMTRGIAVAILILILFFDGHSFAQNSSYDDSIVAAAKNTYIFRTYLKDDNIHIASNQGIVTLSGSVNDITHKSLAEDTVKNLPTVRGVNNQLQIQGENPIENSDAWIMVKVKAALLFHPNVSALKTHVAVKDKVVTLTGEAYSESQKELATEHAKDVDGVKEVKNLMRVVPGANATTMKETFNQKIDDASITAQVKTSLLTHHSTSAISTHVSTENGVVTVSGKAKDPAEIDLVTKLVSDIDGVKSVVNHMSVQ